MKRASRIVERIDRFFGQLSAARECASAIDAGRRPPERSLRALGINPRSFDHIV
ncbi:hypothetical protein [Jiella mangrovi]|uniref:DUF1127 domain-containing protein n=1 Tax=Jiella mangrovi TaxID=2821407 RepID=A0ABS4BJF3_9HYPH|nr:hypothetical protein [Jiella mangrovi]MBP0616887.1 hypothetical protein [Jiella mangrovi]